MSRITLTSLLLALASPVAAQRVPVTLTASLTAPDGKVLPVSGRFWFVTVDGRDSAAANTDGTGTARLELLPGDYRVRSYQRAALAGRAWFWDVPLRGTYQITQRFLRCLSERLVPRQPFDAAAPGSSQPF